MATNAGRLIAMIEDDDDYVQLVIDRLEWQGFSFVTACNAPEGIAAIRAHRPELVILDLQLTQKLEGLRVLRALREEPTTARVPVIIHSILADEREIRTSGIKLGAWYCLDKNDSISELEAYVHRALAIRADGEGRNGRPVLLPLDYDEKRGLVWIDGAPTEIKLSRQQALLLALLVRRAGQICSRDDIAREVYQTPDIADEAIDRLVSRLRAKLDDQNTPARLIQAVRGVGYKLIVPAS